MGKIAFSNPFIIVVLNLRLTIVGFYLAKGLFPVILKYRGCKYEKSLNFDSSSVFGG